MSTYAAIFTLIQTSLDEVLSDTGWGEHAVFIPRIASIFIPNGAGEAAECRICNPAVGLKAQ